MRTPLLRQPLVLSATFHLLVTTAAFSLFWMQRDRPEAPLPFDVIVNPQPAPVGVQPVIPLDKPKPAPTPQDTVKRPAVFGISKKTLMDDAPTDTPVAVKRGNTVAKAPDDLKLKDDDAESLPIPTDAYLVTAMPQLLAEIRIPYPEEARRAGLQGPVVMDLLVDEQGEVRDVALIDGPDTTLNQAALEAVRRLRFKPARVAEKAVAVRIRYVYRFVLEK